MNNPQHQKVLTNNVNIVGALKATAGATRNLTTQFQANSWIPYTENPTAEELVTTALGRIKLVPAEFDIFIGMLKAVPGLGPIVKILEGSTTNVHAQEQEPHRPPEGHIEGEGPTNTVQHEETDDSAPPINTQVTDPSTPLINASTSTQVGPTEGYGSGTRNGSGTGNGSGTRNGSGSGNGSGTGTKIKRTLDITMPGTGITVRNVLQGTSATVVTILILLVVLAVATVIIVRELKD